MGYPASIKGYRLVHKEDNSYRFFVGRDVIFKEDPFASLLNNKKTNTQSTSILIIISGFQIESTSKPNTSHLETPNPICEYEISTINPSISTSDVRNEQVKPSDVSFDDPDDHNESEQEEIPQNSSLNNYLLSTYRTRKEIKRPSRYLDANLVIYALNASYTNYYKLKIFQDASTCFDSSKWLKNMDEELDSLNKNQTWILLDNPNNEKRVTCKWVYRIKESLLENDSTRFKVRLVAKSFTQKPELDYSEFFSPTIRYVTIRIMLVITAYNNQELELIDVKTTFLHGFLGIYIYICSNLRAILRILTRCVFSKCHYMARNNYPDNGMRDSTTLFRPLALKEVPLIRVCTIRTVILCVFSSYFMWMIINES